MCESAVKDGRRGRGRARQGRFGQGEGAGESNESKCMLLRTQCNSDDAAHVPWQEGGKGLRRDKTYRVSFESSSEVMPGWTGRKGVARPRPLASYVLQ
jgi:hypothetical protein